MGRTKNFDSDEYLKDCIKRFYEKIKINENGCWLWIGCTNKKYGFLRFKNANMYAHRFCFEYIKNIPIEGKLVCHTCDNPLCVNPEHLFIGTHKDNMQDAVSKRRVAFGEKHYQNKLKKHDIEEIRKLVRCGMSQSQIAEIFDVEQSNISKIIIGKNWKYSIPHTYDMDVLIKCIEIFFGKAETYKLLKFYDKMKESLSVR